PTQPKASAPPLAGLDLELTADPYAACEGASALVVLTEWPQFTQLDLSKVAEVMARPALVDTRRLFDAEVVSAAGLRYLGTGRS
ncbi:MAG: UDP binding domain-containing protein, partial [Acidimicrobiales bacterium]